MVIAHVVLSLSCNCCSKSPPIPPKISLLRLLPYTNSAYSSARLMDWSLKLTVLCFTVLWSLTTIVRLAFTILTNPFRAFKKKKRHG